MALTRNSKMIEARRKARALAQKIQEREGKLVALAEDYFVADAEVGQIIDAAEAKVDQIMIAAQGKADEVRAAAKVRAEKKNESTNGIIQKMLSLDVPKSEVAARLGVSASTVRKAAAAFTTKAAPAAADDVSPSASTGDAEHHHD